MTLGLFYIIISYISGEVKNVFIAFVIPLKRGIHLGLIKKCRIPVCAGMTKRVDCMHKKEHGYYVYILASKINGTLYIGVTNNLLARSFQHKIKIDKKSFTAKYSVDKLVYFEEYQYIQDAIERETQMKKWNRAWKIELIEKNNKEWKDLFNYTV